MNEIYWITRLNSICGILSWTAVISIFVFITAVFLWVNTLNSHNEEDKVVCKKSIKFMKISFIIFIISILINAFTPTSKEFMLIYGVGGTLNYIKSNDTAKQLPDKCIKALDKFIDEYNNN